MDTRKKRWLFTLVVLFSGLSGVPAVSQANNNLKVAIIDTQEVLSASTAMRQINRFIEQERAELQSKFRGKEQDLIKASRTLSQERSILAPSVFAQRKGDIDRASAQVRKDAKEMKARLATVYANAVERVRQEMNKIILARMKNQMFDLVIEKGATVFFRSDLEITGQIIGELNSTLPILSDSLPQKTE